MARFRFLSLDYAGHLDFGGGGFLRTAQALAQAGHDVRWTTTNRGGDVAGLLAEAEITRIPIDPPPKLQGRFDPQEIAHGIRQLGRALERDGVHVLVADRSLTFAGLAAREAGIPWAAVGTDGCTWREWHADGVQHNARGVHERWRDAFGGVHDLLGVPPAEREPPSEWLRSPFLALSFLPEAYWHDGEVDVPAHAHFVGGSPGGTTDVLPEPTRVVVAAGTSWSKRTLTAVVRALAGLTEELGLDLDVVTGRGDTAARLAPLLPPESVAAWRDYDALFAGAAAAAGHGGTAFVWQCLARGIPALAIGPKVGNQTFNAARLEQLGAGACIAAIEPDPAEVAAALRAVLGSEAMRGRCRELAAGVRSGGGPDAAAALLETLARERRPLTACVASPCCCAGARRPAGAAA